MLKSDDRIEAYGTVDELNSYIGLCRDILTNPEGRVELQEIQDRLFTIGSALASDPAKEIKLKLPDLGEDDIIYLENNIDRMNKEMPEMRSFILPGGHPTVSQLHIARCVCRRAERCCVRLLGEAAETSSLIIKYLNRLSDYLFILARYTGQELGVEEIKWRPRM